MNKILQVLKPQVSLPIALAILVGLSGVFVMSPRASRIVKAENCNNAPSVATLNFYPVTWGNVAGVNCLDFAPISIRNVNNPNYAPSVSAQPGEEMYVSIYVHNGARQDGDPNQTTAQNVNGSISLSGNTISTSFAGSNTNTKTGDVTVDMPSGATLEIIPGTEEFFDYQFRPISKSVNLTTTGGSFNLGDMLACFEYSIQLRFKVKVVGAAAGTGNIDAQTKDQNCPAGNYNGIVSWNVSGGVTQSAVYVDDLNDNLGPQYFSGELWAENKAISLIPNHTFVFTLYSVQNGVETKISEDSTGVVPALNCGEDATGNIDVVVQSQNCPAGNYNGIVSWNVSGGVTQSAVYVDDLNDNLGPQYFSGELWAENKAISLIPNHTFVFTLYSVQNGVETKISEDSTGVVPALNCGEGPTTLVCTPQTQTVNSGAQASITASGGTAPYSWKEGGVVVSTQPTITRTYTNPLTSTQTNTLTVSSSDGQTKTCIIYVNGVSAPQSASIVITKDVRNITQNQSTFVDSTSAKQNDTLEYRIVVSAGSSVALNNVVVTDTFASGLTYLSGSIRVNGQPHSAGLSSGGLTFSSVSQGSPLTITYQATVNASSGTIVNTAKATASNSINFPSDTATVNVTTNPVSVNCTANPTVININGSTTFSASGGNGSYSWTVTGGSVTNSTQQSFNSTFNTAGTFIATVSSGGNSATCNVVVNSNPNNLVCYANPSVISSGQSVTFTASGGSGSYTWHDNGNTYFGSSYTPNPNYINNSTGSITRTVTVNSGGQTVQCSVTINGISNPGQAILNISKMVRNTNGGAYQNSVTVNTNDTVQFEIVVTNNGSQTANNVRVTDNLTNGLSLVPGSVTVDGSYASDSTIYSGMYLGNLVPGQQKRINFQARINSTGSSSIQNVAVANSDNAGSVQASAWVFVSQVSGGNVNLNYSKRAFNETRNADATTVTAQREDFITYTLTVNNSGNTPANNFVITDDLSQVLQYADMVDNGGGSLNGSVINYPGITVPAGGSVSRSFKVRVKFSLASNLSYTMTNTYGNTVTVRINTPQVLGNFVAPKTGAETAAFSFAGIFTGAAALIRKRKYLMKLIFT